MQVYISGALTRVTNLEELRGFYESLGMICQKHGASPYIPHQYTDPEKNPDVSPTEVYSTDRSAIKASSLLVAYVGSPSTGVGQEIEIAYQIGIPVVLLFEKGKEPSRMVRGNPSVVEKIIFDNYEDGVIKFSEWFSRSIQFIQSYQLKNEI